METDPLHDLFWILFSARGHASICTIPIAANPVYVESGVAVSTHNGNIYMPANFLMGDGSMLLE